LSRFSVSEEFISPTEVTYPRDHRMYADDLGYQAAAARADELRSRNE
jgi:hypothetical protein